MYVKDIFYSIQGEGVYIGRPQVFIRFWGCNIHCAYCDEPDFEKDKINRPLDWVVDQVRPFLDQPLHSISITGGEPLLHTAAIRDLASVLDTPLYLETNGTLPDRLDEVKDLFSYFAVDYKPGFESELAVFLDKLSGRDGVFLKYVMCSGFPESHLLFLLDLLESHPDLPLILQPVTPFAEVTTTVSSDDILRAFRICAERHGDVRVIGQTHKFIGLK